MTPPREADGHTGGMTPTEKDPAALQAQARADVQATEDAAVECARLDKTRHLYRLMQTDGPIVASLVDTPAREFSVNGWRYAAVLAMAEADDSPDSIVAPLIELADEFRRRALECAGQNPDLDPGSFGYLDTIYPRRVKASGDTIVVECGIPLRRDGAACTWRAGRTGAAAHQAHDAYVAHVIHDHSTTAARPGANPGDAF